MSSISGEPNAVAHSDAPTSSLVRNGPEHPGSSGDLSAAPETGISQENTTETVEEGEVFYSQEDDRLNRFQGSSSTWRHLTQEERDLAASLDQQQSNNLSIHLYNAHALKARARDSATAANAKSTNSKKRRTKVEDDGSSTWSPDTAWTAWPLGPRDVPRSGESFGVPILSAGEDDSTYRMLEPWKPSAELEEEVKALMLRRAKDLYRQRMQAFASDEPTALVDEDEADAILQPAVRHILSQLDELLTALRTTRRGHGSRSQSRSQSRRRSSRLKRASQHSGEEDDNDNETNDKSNGDQSEGAQDLKHQPKRRRRLNTRDWSEVLNLAPLTGFDAAVVERAKSRCASLFAKDGALSTVPTATHDDSLTNTKLHETRMNFWNCPFPDCARSLSPYDTAWRWREHLKRTHKYSKDAIAEAERKLNGEELIADREAP
ncbi:RNA polymerase I-specific transcription initiation factor-domain-containing protein [Neohortaea acidophila]|uniref:RNA polymerase I-specific transcription initiation factor-domain-containing protein n=1 Tax=Neohortaea acidophila TaxID=245834 RepID=A0A6A6PVF7_9PEZI|nr:RNA polymerase I-specific transcription initiation factor-domain-containing protein [Neohortaea acidophila]KAF2484128.1 RNA polymerase I-specific transcription initiation factor-domain-containing protein [Neohortaea acidophila]